ncbi:MAG: hypothetical protein ACI4CX_00250, partial [Candidatus Weimeria sp.]
LLFALMEQNDEESIADIVNTYHIRDDDLERARAVFKAAGETKKIDDAIKNITSEDTDIHDFVNGLKSDYIKRYGA